MESTLKTLDKNEKDSEGRYLYCLIDTNNQEKGNFSISGIKNESVYIVEKKDIGAIVHQCRSLYDTGDLEKLKQWLLTHQRVVDKTGEIYGTPLPFQFDTVFKGHDKKLKSWIEQNYQKIRNQINQFKGHWEYHIDLLWDESSFTEKIEKENDKLQKLKEQQEKSDSGKKFMLQKKYEEHLKKLKQNKEEQLHQSLIDKIDPIIDDVSSKDTNFSLYQKPDNPESTPISELSVLVKEEKEDILGEKLDIVAANPQIRIRFTGPWPPYSFVSDFN